MIVTRHVTFQTRRSSEGWNPGGNPSPKGFKLNASHEGMTWIPAFAGMTNSV